MKFKIFILCILFFNNNLKSQTINADMFFQLHNVTNVEMLSSTADAVTGSLVFNTSDKSVYNFDGILWVKLTPNKGKLIIDILSSSAVTYQFTPPLADVYFDLNACITPIVYQVLAGDIIDLSLQLSSDYIHYNNIGSVVRFHITIDGTEVSNTIFSGFFAGGDNYRETAHVSLNQSFKVMNSGELSVGIKIKSLNLSNCIYNPSYQGDGGLIMKVYR